MRTLLAMMAALGACIGPWTAAAEPVQGLDKWGDLCARATSQRERAGAVPDHLLRAISLAETGRWDDASREKFAWPWTVTSGGEGEFYPTKKAAIARVRALRDQGVTNIDVGCMQVNMRYHAEAFPDLETAFDPARNVAYAAGFLKRLHQARGSWSQATAAYHSSDPARGRSYRLKVLRLWHEARRAAAPGGTPAADPGPRPYAPSVAPGAHASVVAPRQYGAGIDVARTTALNARLKTARATQRGYDRAMKRHDQLAEWRRARIKGMGTTHLAAMRRAQAELREKLKYAAAGRPDFESRRRAQFDQWRRNLPGAGS